MYSIKLEKESLLPREKLVRNGAEQLSDQELLAIILRTGNKDKHVMELAANLLNTVSSLSDFKKMSLQELRQLAGIGNVKSIELKAMLEFSRRIQESEQTCQYQILSSFQIAKKMIKQLGDKEQEHLVALYLDTQNRVIEEKTIFIGSVRRSIAEPREILHYACRNMATSMIIIHNHPSGFVDPSENDYHFTKNIKQLCDQIGIACLDHIIVGKNNYYSFREKTNLFCEKTLE
ncbi:RadC family protein [Streptococcus porcinus]|uniref:DNA repair protein RadC n=2 Tax=Streptococcus porcinus TaxID=1340 RepID=A0A4V0H859_STRPO|nr:DNA repair protein RadC [Streptococcus porcinus]EGJ28270.1 DNA repair protein RadC [Streptococcus porcinus str. Jelinkova 176]SQG44279.1 DNA repair protein RadC [Streptococcus porcinus]VTT43897.1 DNA repair protein RadC [Streptococcus porcinus]VTT45277.1 DNA repair protein RadC [Streptococcus porcinus]